MAGMASPNGGHVRMVISYWDMACSLVVNGAIDEKMFNDANGEHLVVFGKIEGLHSEMAGNDGRPERLEESGDRGSGCAGCPQENRRD